MADELQIAQGIQVKLIQSQPIPLAIDLYCQAGEVLAMVGLR